MVFLVAVLVTTIIFLYNFTIQLFTKQSKAFPSASGSSCYIDWYVAVLNKSQCSSPRWMSYPVIWAIKQHITKTLRYVFLTVFNVSNLPQSGHICDLVWQTMVRNPCTSQYAYAQKAAGTRLMLSEMSL